MANPVALSRDDVAVLRRVIDRFDHLIRGEANRPAVVNDGIPAPEMYVARTPFGGIPALDLGADKRTGTGGSADDEPGSAECDIYELQESDTVGVSPAFKLVEGLRPLVYNIGFGRIPGNRWIQVHRDKFGRWWAAGTSGDDTGESSGAGGFGTGTGTGTGTDSACRTILGGLPLSTIPGYRSDRVQLLGHDAVGCLEWFDVGQC